MHAHLLAIVRKCKKVVLVYFLAIVRKWAITSSVRITGTFLSIFVQVRYMSSVSPVRITGTFLSTCVQVHVLCVTSEDYRYVFVHLYTGTLHVLCVTSEDYRYVFVHLCKGMCSPVSQVRTAGTLHRSQ